MPSFSLCCFRISESNLLSSMLATTNICLSNNPIVIYPIGLINVDFFNHIK